MNLKKISLLGLLFLCITSVKPGHDKKLVLRIETFDGMNFQMKKQGFVGLQSFSEFTTSPVALTTDTVVISQAGAINLKSGDMIRYVVPLAVLKEMFEKEKEKPKTVMVNNGAELRDFASCTDRDNISLGSLPCTFTSDFGQHKTGEYTRALLSPEFIKRIFTNEDMSSNRLPHRIANLCCNIYDATEKFAKRRPVATGIGAFLGLSAFYGLCLYKGYTKVPGVTGLMNFGSSALQKYPSLGNLFAKKAVEVVNNSVINVAPKAAEII